MKKLIAPFVMLFIILACNNSSNTNSSPSDSATTQSPNDPDVDKGLNLVAANDCFGCHNVSTKIIGPAYQDVANRYKDSSASIVDSLAQRIIRGTSGRWDSTKMTPHPNLAPADARLMVKYILSLK